MKGISYEPVPWVHPDDMMLPEEEQTIFYIKQKGIEATNVSVARYNRMAKSRQAGAAGVEDYSPGELTRADVEEFISTVVKVKNFAFSPSYYERHPEVHKLADERGYIPEIEDPDLLREVARNLPQKVIADIFEASLDAAKLSAGAKKK